jgi:hypothetical protein
LALVPASGNYLLSQAEWGRLEIRGLGTLHHLDFLRRRDQSVWGQHSMVI